MAPMTTEALHIVCPHCHTTNRVQAAQLGSAPDCGNCHRPLFTGEPLALDAATFDRHVGLQAGRGLFEGRRHHAAGAAPGGPEVHQHRDLAAADMAVEARFVQRDRRAGEQRPVAAAAVGLAGEVVGVDAVGGVAVRTDDVQ